MSFSSYDSTRLRSSTLDQRSHSQSEPSKAVKLSRKILSIEETPSLLVDYSRGRAIDTEATRIKTSERILTFFTDGVIQEVLGCQMSRGRTVLQGSQASKGWQAAHHSLDPALVDDALPIIEQRVIDNGVTPMKSGPYLKSRLAIDSPEKQLLQLHHTDEAFVRNFIVSRLPQRGEVSSISGTHFEKRRNATFENPDESNQFDCLLEAHMKLISEELKGKRALGSLSAEEATRYLVGSMLLFYRDSIPNLEKRLESLTEFHVLEKKMIAFENSYGPDVKIPPEALLEYLNQAQRMLQLKEEFLSPHTGVHRWHAVKDRRLDYYHLKKFVKDCKQKESSPDDIQNTYKAIRPFLKTPTVEEISPHIERYHLFLVEAKAQMEETRLFESMSAINNLRTLIFGIQEGSKRRAPSPIELHEQVFSMLKESPIKASHPVKRTKKERDLETFDQENESPDSSHPAKKLAFDLGDSDDELAHSSDELDDSTPDDIRCIQQPSLHE